MTTSSSSSESDSVRSTTSNLGFLRGGDGPGEEPRDEQDDESAI